MDTIKRIKMFDISRKELKTSLEVDPSKTIKEQIDLYNYGTNPPRKREDKCFQATVDGEIVFTGDVHRKDLIVQACYNDPEEEKPKCVCCETPTHRYSTYVIDQEGHPVDAHDILYSAIRRYAHNTKIRITIETMD